MLLRDSPLLHITKRLMRKLFVDIVTLTDENVRNSKYKLLHVAIKTALYATVSAPNAFNCRLISVVCNTKNHG